MPKKIFFPNFPKRNPTYPKQSSYDLGKKPIAY